MTCCRSALQATDLAGLADDSVNAGDSFKIQAWVRDLRSADSDTRGVFAAYLDLLYDADRALVVPDPNNPRGIDITFGPQFPEWSGWRRSRRRGARRSRRVSDDRRSARNRRAVAVHGEVSSEHRAGSRGQRFHSGRHRRGIRCPRQRSTQPRRHSVSNRSRGRISGIRCVDVRSGAAVGSQWNSLPVLHDQCRGWQFPNRRRGSIPARWQGDHCRERTGGAI